MTQSLTEDDDVLNALIATCDDLGIDLKRVIADMGLPAKILTAAQQFIPSHLFNCVLETIAANYHCRDLALHIASELQSPQLGLPTTVMALSNTVGTALNNASKYSAFYHDTSYWQHRISDTEVSLFKAASPFSSEHYRQRNLLGTAQMFLLLNSLSPHLWRPNKVGFSFPDPGVLFSKTFHTFFACDLLFDQAEDSISFAADYLEFHVSGSDINLLRGIENQTAVMKRLLLQDRNLVDQARLLINERLRFAHCTEAELAHFMEISSEQLRDELNRANISFAEILEQQICKRAKEYVKKYHAPIKLITSALMPENEDRLSHLMMNT